MSRTSHVSHPVWGWSVCSLIRWRVCHCLRLERQGQLRKRLEQRAWPQFPVEQIHGFADRWRRWIGNERPTLPMNLDELGNACPAFADESQRIRIVLADPFQLIEQEAIGGGRIGGAPVLMNSHGQNWTWYLLPS